MNVSVHLNFEFKHISAQTTVKNITVVIVGVNIQEYYNVNTHCDENLRSEVAC
jgi:hypothetical protein